MRVIPDDQKEIEQQLIDLADHQACSLIVTTGGTGPAKRDVYSPKQQSLFATNSCPDLARRCVLFH